MSLSANGGAGVWRWLAAFLAGVVLAGMPAAFVSLTAPRRGEYDRLRGELIVTQVQLARIEERLVSQERTTDEGLATLQAQVAELRAAVDRQR